MENIILSMLLLKSMTVYEMKVFIAKGLTTVCSDSLGSIQSGIKKLMSKGCIVVREYTENNLLKKEYSITDQGVEQFREWIEIPMNLEKVRNMEEGKFFFLGMAPKEVRI
ncbi:MAG: PadR family transcriptional regulator, partial [Cellulosilyticaceae bacterium]